METEWKGKHTVRLVEYLHRPGYRIPHGFGTERAACSMAAIRLAWDGELSSRPPRCMSAVLGEWLPVIQDEMPDEVRNSAAWKAILPLAAATGREREDERQRVIEQIMWENLVYGQTLADRGGYGREWRLMCRNHTKKTAIAVKDAAEELIEIDSYEHYSAKYTANCVYWYLCNKDGDVLEAVNRAARAVCNIADMPVEDRAEQHWDRIDPIASMLRIINA